MAGDQHGSRPQCGAYESAGDRQSRVNQDDGTDSQRSEPVDLGTIREGMLGRRVDHVALTCPRKP